jgi:hypothetical protein
LIPHLPRRRLAANTVVIPTTRMRQAKASKITLVVMSSSL